MAKSPITNSPFKDAVEKKVSVGSGDKGVRHVSGVPQRSGSGTPEVLYDSNQPTIPSKTVAKTDFQWKLKKG